MPLMLVTLAGCSHVAAGPADRQPSVAVRSAVAVRNHRSPVPLVDHHQHLLGPTMAAVLNRPPLPAVTLPSEIAQLLAHRAERTRDGSLGALFTEHALLLSPGPQGGWIRGGAAAAQSIKQLFSPGYRLTPVSYESRGNMAQVAGYYTRGEGDSVRHPGYFTMNLIRGADRKWLISSETPVFPGPGTLPVLDARRLVQMMNAAGIQRSVVLSEAFLVGAKNMDVVRAPATQSEKLRMVQAENDWTAQQVALFPHRLIAFCSFNPMDQFALAELDRCASSGSFRGVKLHLDESSVDLAVQAHVDRVRQVFASANRHGLPIAIHVGNNVGLDADVRRNVQTFLNEIMPAAPDVPVQIAHLWGGGGFSEPALAAYADAVAAGAPGTKNLYFDISDAALMGSRTGERAVETLGIIAQRMRQIGFERLLYGSDAAFLGHPDPRQAWAQTRSELPLTKDEVRTLARNVAPYLQ